MSEKIEKIKLKSGLQVVFVFDERFTTSTIRMVFNIGWRHDEEKYLGLAHLFEHLIGKRTKKFKQKSEFDRKKEELGIVSNAWTGPDETGYFQSQTHDKLLKSLDLFFEAIYNSTFNDEDLKKEKEVVMTEARRYLDNDDSLIFHEMMKSLFPGTTMAKFFFGTDKTMKNINVETFSSFYEIYKNPLNGVLYIGTNKKNKKKEILDFLNKFYSEYKNLNEIKITAINEKIPKPIKEKTIEKKDKTQANIRLAYRIRQLSLKERITFVVLKRILVGGLTSYIYKKLRDELGLIYSIGLGRNYFLGGINYTVFGTQTKKDEVENLITALKEELLNVKEKITQNDVKKIIPIIEYYESLEVNTENIVDAVADAEFYNLKYINSKEFLSMLRKVKVGDVKALLHELFVENEMIKVVLK